MGRFRPKTFGITIIAIATVIIIILASINSDGALAVNLGLPVLDITTNQFGERVVTNQDTGQELIIIEGFDVPLVACWVAQEVVVRDEQGGFIANVKSDFFKSTPIIAVPLGSFIDKETGKSVALGSYQTNPQIKCSTGKIIVNTQSGFGADPEKLIDPITAFEQVFPSFDTPLTVEDSFFTIRIYALLPNNTWIEVFNAPYKIDKFDITSPQRIFLPSYKVQQEWIQRELPDGSYDTTLKFVYDGAMVMHWKQVNICGAGCAKVLFVIPFVTEKIFNAEGLLTSVENEFDVTRVVTVGVAGNNGGQGTECDGITTTVDPETGICVPKPEPPCLKGEHRSGTGIASVCVTTGGNGNGAGGIDVTIKEIFGKLQTCFASGDPTCLASGDFLPFWIFGIGLVVILGAVAQSRQPEIYGVPR